MPDQVRHDDLGTFYDFIIIKCQMTNVQMPNEAQMTKPKKTKIIRIVLHGKMGLFRTLGIGA